MSKDKEAREKLVSRGVESLTTAELIGIVIRDGSEAMSATDQAQRVLDCVDGSLMQLATMDLRRLRLLEGLGAKRAAVLCAALELGRRLSREEAQTPTQINTTADVIKLFTPRIAHLPHEEFWAIYLSSANTVIDTTKVSQGGVSGTVVDYRIIVKRAIELLASSIILIHNHPSGVAEPSVEDIEITRRIEKAASLFDLLVLDHVIVSGGGSVSFREKGLVE